MAILTSALIQALQTSVSQQYAQGWSDATPWYQNVASVVPSSVRTNTYGWMQRLPAMRQWIGARTLQNLSNHDYTLTNIPYELTVEVNKEDWEDDMLGVYSPLFQEIGRAARKLPDIQMVTALQAGVTTGLGFDGVTFFNNAHPALGAGAVIDNNFAATALSAANYAAVRAAMMAFQGEDGQPLGVMPNLLVVPPQLEGTARLILNAEMIGNAGGTASETNIWRNSASLLVVPELAAQATTWYMFDVSRPIKPMIWQNRKAPVLVPRTSPDDPHVFDTNNLLWGVDGRGAAGYGPFFLAARAIA